MDAWMNFSVAHVKKHVALEVRLCDHCFMCFYTRHMAFSCRKNVRLKLGSILFDEGIIGGGLEVSWQSLILSWPSFSASQTFEIGTKASAALADYISCPGQFSFISALSQHLRKCTTY